MKMVEPIFREGETQRVVRIEGANFDAVEMIAKLAEQQGLAVTFSGTVIVRKSGNVAVGHIAETVLYGGR